MRFLKKARSYAYLLNNEVINQAEYQQYILPLLAFIRHADTFNFRKKYMIDFVLLLSGKSFYRTAIIIYRV